MLARGSGGAAPSDPSGSSEAKKGRVCCVGMESPTEVVTPARSALSDPKQQPVSAWYRRRRTEVVALACCPHWSNVLPMCRHRTADESRRVQRRTRSRGRRIIADGSCCALVTRRAPKSARLCRPHIADGSRRAVSIGSVSFARSVSAWCRRRRLSRRKRRAWTTAAERCRHDITDERCPCTRWLGETGGSSVGCISSTEVVALLAALGAAGTALCRLHVADGGCRAAERPMSESGL